VADGPLTSQNALFRHLVKNMHFLNVCEHKVQSQISILSFIAQTNLPHRIHTNCHDTTPTFFGKTVPSSGIPHCQFNN
jgi:hypothetical protein